MISNALKFTTDGFIAFGYTLKDNLVQFHVIDTGIGIPEEKAKKIFNSFEQGDNSLNKKYDGLGIGLSNSSELVKLLGGKIKLESEKNIGSFFTIDIHVNNIEYINNEISDKYIQNANLTWPSETYALAKNKMTGYNNINMENNNGANNNSLFTSH